MNQQESTPVETRPAGIYVDKFEPMLDCGGLLARFNLTVVTGTLGVFTVHRCSFFRNTKGEFFWKGPSFENPKFQKGSDRKYLNPLQISEEAQAGVIDRCREAFTTLAAMAQGAATTSV